jgi:hypothetical protein
MKSQRSDPGDPLNRRVRARREAFAEAPATCRVELERRLDGKNASGSPESLQGPIVAFAAAARSEKIPPQRVLAAFKEMVFRLPQVDRLDVDERTAVIRAIVTMTIEAYYGDCDGNRESVAR